MNVHTHSDRAVVLLRWYKRWLSPAFGNSCRFTPTCSEYAAQAVAEHGWIRGGMLALRRLLRCHPFATAGFDPVPYHGCSDSKEGVSSFAFQVSAKPNVATDVLKPETQNPKLEAPLLFLRASVVNEFSRHSS